MLQMIGPVAGQVGADGDRTQPLPYPFIDCLVAVNSTMSGFVHQNGKPELARANHHHRDQPCQGIWPERNQRDRSNNGAPGVSDEPHAAQRAA